MHQMIEEKPLLAALSELYPDSSKRTLSHWIKFGRVCVDSEVMTRPNHLVLAGQTVAVQPRENQSFEGIEILYQDRAVVVINKPKNLLSVALDTETKEHALGILRYHLNTPALFAVHRLDRETSGVLLFARGKASEDYFDDLFERHDIARHYAAIVEGHLPQRQGTWDSYLEEQENFEVKVVPEGQGKRAITHYEVVRRSKLFTYATMKLETGRKHQIRVHCKEAGHPIVGDKRYGSTLDPLRRMGLHASLLTFKHPFTGKEMTFTAPLPKPFLNLGYSA